MDLEIENKIILASKERNVQKFMEYLFPEEWYPIIARIIESGVEFDENECLWCPRWSNIPWTVKKGTTELHAALKTCMYRLHDCFHQLWGLPIPSQNFTEDEYYLFKRAQMCGEVAVLTLTEFIYADYLYESSPLYSNIRTILNKRCGVPIMKTVFKDKTPVEIAMRLDGILHKKAIPKWVRDNKIVMEWANYYVPMLETDRTAIDNNWAAMKKANWIPIDAPNSRYNENLDGLELTIWLINDFYHLLKTDTKIDWPLTKFNRERRKTIKLPQGWK